MDSPPGQYALAWEQNQIDDMVANVFGYHAIQLGLSKINFLRTSRISHKGVIALPGEGRTGAHQVLVADPRALPLESQSVDLLVLPHLLECSSHPHHVLREVERVLMPEGRVVISGFNPWSLWGLRERIPGLDPLLPWPAHMQVSLLRLKDWLELLSFELENSQFGGYVPLCESEQWLRRWSFMDRAGPRWWRVMGALYVMVAVKRVRGMRLVGPAWRRPAKQKANSGAVVRAEIK